MIGPRGGFGGHIGALRDFHLDRVDTLFRSAIMARGPATFKTTIQNFGRETGGENGITHRLRATDPRIGADVENRQGAFEQIGDIGPDRMTII